MYVPSGNIERKICLKHLEFKINIILLNPNWQYIMFLSKKYF